jgi:hypothetical protein
MMPPNSTPSNDGEGLSILDLEHLPRPQYRVMRVMLREVECTHARLCEVMLETEQMPLVETEQVIKELVEAQWMLLNEGKYRANLRRKTGRVLSEFQPPRRKSPSLRGIWDSLEQGNNPKK